MQQEYNKRTVSSYFKMMLAAALAGSVLAGCARRASESTEWIGTGTLVSISGAGGTKEVQVERDSRLVVYTDQNGIEKTAVISEKDLRLYNALALPIGSEITYGITTVEKEPSFLMSRFLETVKKIDAYEVTKNITGYSYEYNTVIAAGNKFAEEASDA